MVDGETKEERANAVNYGAQEPAVELTDVGRTKLVVEESHRAKVPSAAPWGTIL